MHGRNGARGPAVVRARLTAPRTLAFEPLDLRPDALGAKDVYAQTECSAVSIGTEAAAYVAKSRVLHRLRVELGDLME